MPYRAQTEVGFSASYRGWNIKVDYGIMNIYAKITIMQTGVTLLRDIIRANKELQEPIGKTEKLSIKEQRRKILAELTEKLSFFPTFEFKSKTIFFTNRDVFYNEAKQYIDANLGDFKSYAKQHYLNDL